MKNRTIIQMGSLGFLIAFLSFFIFAALLLPIDLSDPVEMIIMGNVDASIDLSTIISKILPGIYAIDTVLIVGWLIGWTGISLLILKRNKPAGLIILFLGMLGPILDFLENETSWAIINLINHDKQVSTNWIIAWKVVRQFGFIISYTGAIILGLFLWSHDILDRIVSIICIVGAVFGIFGLYISLLWIASQAWWPVWFASLGFLLWRRRIEFT